MSQVALAEAAGVDTRQIPRYETAGVAARGDHARFGGEGQPVAAGPAQGGDDGPLADPARGVDAGEPVNDVLRDEPHRAGQRQGAARR